MDIKIDIQGDDDLLQLLFDAEVEDLSVLVDHLTDTGKGRLSLSKEVCEVLHDARQRQKFSRDVLCLLIREIQHFGGNTMRNLLRRNGVPYAEIVRDVLEHVGGVSSKTEAVESMELKILETLVAKIWGEMSAAQQAEFARKFGSVEQANAGAFVAIQAAIRHGGPSAVHAASLISGTFFRVSPFLHIAALPFNALLGFYGLASPAYRVTLPCVVLIAYIRQKKALTTCLSCGEGNLRSAKFCSECGVRLGA